MPKMKTHRGAAKRFKKTGTGKLLRQRANRQHLFEEKPSTRTRRLKGEVEVNSATLPASSACSATANPSVFTSRPQRSSQWPGSSAPSPARSIAVPSSSGPRATTATRAARTAPPTSRSCTRLQYAFRDRRARKGDFRELWIQRINAGVPPERHQLQPVHRRPARRGHRGRPQGPGRPRRHRPGGVRCAGRVAPRPPSTRKRRTPRQSGTAVNAQKAS